MSRIVIALGGNALGNTPSEQKLKIAEAVPALVGLIKQGHEIIVSHGNGPQVGMIGLAFETAATYNSNVVAMELPECTAMSQGYIGYHLQQAIKKQIRIEKMPWNAVTVVTQVVVDENDLAFKTPTKPIGAFYSEADAKEIMLKNPNLVFTDDAGRGFRRMVASPKPVDIVEKDAILNLISNEFIVIACGGGGVPVLKDSNGDYFGVPAVIDKDFASAKLAELVSADYLFILTAVDRVSINWGKPEQEDISEMNTETAEKYCGEGHFAPGSMLPKVQAAIGFAKSGKGCKAVIASLEKASLAMEGKSGTIISNY